MEESDGRIRAAEEVVTLHESVIFYGEVVEEDGEVYVEVDVGGYEEVLEVGGDDFTEVVEAY